MLATGILFLENSFYCVWIKVFILDETIIIFAMVMKKSTAVALWSAHKINKRLTLYPFLIVSDISLANIYAHI